MAIAPDAIEDLVAPAEADVQYLQWIPASAGKTDLAAALVTLRDASGGSGFPEGAITLRRAMPYILPKAALGQAFRNS